MTVHMMAYWRHLRWLCIGWIFALLLTSVLVGWSVYLQSVVAAAWAQQQSAWVAWQQQRALSLQYQQWQAAHKRQRAQSVMLASEDWPVQLFTLQQAYGLPHLTYQIQPAVACHATDCDLPALAALPPGGTLLRTPLQLRWSLTTISPTLQWLHRLAQHALGMLRVRQCTWSVSSATTTLEAVCEVEVFHFSPNPLADDGARHVSP